MSELQRDIERHFHRPLEELLERMYWSEFLTYQQIADVLGCSPSFVGVHIRNLGLSYRQLAKRYYDERVNTVPALEVVT